MSNFSEEQLSLFDNNKKEKPKPEEPSIDAPVEEGPVAYLQAIDYLEDKLQYGIKPGTERIEALLQELGNPHKKFKTILVTGTNGKTSTSRIITALLDSHSYKTGLYTSPHLHSYCERIVIGNRQISESSFSQTLQELKAAIKKVDEETKDPLTNFEIITAMAFQYFAKQEVDLAVLEVGMGARFDATCLTNARVSVITNVELDHSEYLGSSIEQIAYEKSFVIKEGSSVVLGEIRPQVLKVIEERCKEKKAKIYALNKDFSLRSVEIMMDQTQLIDIDGLYCQYRHINLPVLGKHQAVNTAIALAAAEKYNHKFLMLKKFKHPLSHLAFNGRLEVMQQRPLMIIDGAHNPAGARKLAQTLKNQLEYDKLILVLAIYRDKDYIGIIDELAPLANKLIFSENSSERCAEASLLAKKVPNAFKGNSKIIKPLSEAINTAKRMADINDLVCITGSLGTVADARIVLGKLKDKSEKLKTTD